MSSSTVEILPRVVRAHQGDPRITHWCDRCQERVVVMRSGRCGWCDLKIARDERPEVLRRQRDVAEARAREVREKLEARRTTNSYRVLTFVQANPGATCQEVTEGLGMPRVSARSALAHLQAYGRIEVCGTKPTRARAMNRWRALRIPAVSGTKSPATSDVPVTGCDHETENEKRASAAATAWPMATGAKS